MMYADCGCQTLEALESEHAAALDKLAEVQRQELAPGQESRLANRSNATLVSSC